MPIKENINFKNPFYLFTADLETIVPAVFRKVEGVTYFRERITTPDQDFLDLDWSGPKKVSDSLIIISHGLEGDSYRPYVLGLVKALKCLKADVLAWNFRGCSGELNKIQRFYHSGETEDLNQVIQYTLTKGYKKIILIGFSIGGNITLKYLGENRKYPRELITAIAVSVPCHLASTAKHLAKFRSKIYMSRFMVSLSKKIKEKEKIFPGTYQIEKLSAIKTFLEFDTLFTAPINGFQNAEEYWKKSSSIFYLNNIQIPTLIINAKNDPFLTPECFPKKEAEENKNISLEITEKGGHCGFYEQGKEISWLENRVLDCIKSYI